MRALHLASFALIAAAAVSARDAFAYGEPINGYPTHQERLILVSINRVRADPNDQAAGNANPCSTPHPPIPPVAYEPTLSHASRFHCNHLTLNMGGLSHNTYCTLDPAIANNGCDGHAACSCMPATECWKCDTLGGCGSGPWDRAQIFGFNGLHSEVGAANYGAQGAATGWATECPGAEGHRDALSDGGVNVAGIGYSEGPGCWGNYEFADFGNVAMPTPRIASGVDTGSGFEANYYDAAGDPISISVVVDGTCHDMTPAVGINAGNRDYRAMLAPSGACQQYYFVARDKGGMVVHYPDVGSLTVGCPMDYVATQMSATCDACNPGDMKPCGVGACAGMQACANGAWAACSGAAPTAESCNGVDDDCNGVVDDGCPASTTGTGPSATSGTGLATGPGVGSGPTSGGAGGGKSVGAGFTTSGATGTGGANADQGGLEGGCGCETQGRGGSGQLAALALVLGLAGARRSRKRR